MTGFIANVFPFRNRVSLNEAFEVLEPDDGKPSCPVLRGPGDRKVAWLLDEVDLGHGTLTVWRTNQTRPLPGKGYSVGYHCILELNA